MLLLKRKKAAADKYEHVEGYRVGMEALITMGGTPIKHVPKCRLLELLDRGDEPAHESKLYRDFKYAAQVGRQRVEASGVRFHDPRVLLQYDVEEVPLRRDLQAPDLDVWEDAEQAEAQGVSLHLAQARHADRIPDSGVDPHHS